MVRHRLSCALLTALVLATPLGAVHAQQAPLELSLLRGGQLGADPVVDGDLVHFASGRAIVTWDYSDPAAPVELRTSAPATGVITGLTRSGEHLYASWRGYEGSSGVATWSLADPAAPELVDDHQAYTDAEEKHATGIVAANDHLYLFDAYNGVFVSGLDDRAHPRFSPAPGDELPAAYTRIVAHGDMLHASGRNWVGSTMLHLYDVSAPTAPLRIAGHTVDGIASFSMVMDPERAIGIGNELTVFDHTDPTMLNPRGVLDIPAAITGARIGDVVYSFGYGDGLDISSIADPEAPQLLGHLDIEAISTRRSVRLNENTLLLPSEVDLIHTLDVSAPAAPEPIASPLLSGGAIPMDVAEHDGRLLLLQYNYGMTVNDGQTLAPLGRFHADLPAHLETRAFEQLAVAGDIAFLANWGAGLTTVDLSDPEMPVELGQMPFFGAAMIDVEGDHAYLASWTNGGRLGVADVSDPAAPALVWEGPRRSQPYHLQVEAGHLFLAEGREYGTDDGGLRVFNLDDPAAPVEVAHLSDDCDAAFDLSIDAEVSLLYLACNSGMQVIDIATPAAPTVVGRYQLEEDHSFTRIAQRLDRAWFANHAGLHQIDVSDPTAPTLVELTPLGLQGANRLHALDDGRLVAVGNNSGVHVFAPGDGDDATPIENRVPVRVPETDADDSRLYTIEVPEGASMLNVLSYGGRGNADLLVRHGAAPSIDTYDARSMRPGNNEAVRIAAPAAGTWYIRVLGTAAFSGVTLQARQ